MNTGKPSLSPTPPEPHGYQIPWVRALVNFCLLLLLIAGVYEGYVQLQKHAQALIKQKIERIEVRAELENTPRWLDARILKQILDQTNHLALRDRATLDRFKDPLDDGILREIAANYTGTDPAGVNHAALGANAWIKQVNEVRRLISPDRRLQTIQIFAEFRYPAAWIERDGKYYLIDPDQVRLPEEYSAEDRQRAAALMVITGVELPGNSARVPQPGESWSTLDVAAGLKLAGVLAREPYVRQVDAIDMTNFQGRKDALRPWIVLNTVFSTAAGKPRTVLWGRPVGEESYYEVRLPVKLKALHDIYFRFNRIDADRDFVDIRFDQILLPVPNLAAQSETAQPTIIPHG